MYPVRRHLLSIPLLMCLVLTTACSPRAARPTPTAGPRSTAPTASGDLGSVQSAYALLMQRSVDHQSSSALLSAALDGVADSALRAGVVPPQVARPKFTDDPNQDWSLFAQAFVAAVNRYHSKVYPSQMVQAAIRGMVAKVDDCHTAYLDPTQYPDEVARLQGNTTIGGIGAALRKPKLADPLVIWRVFDGTPAARAGLKRGDVILAVDGRDVSDLTLDGAVALIRGPEGSTVRLLIHRFGLTAPFEVAIVRGQVTPPIVEAAMLQNRVGYLRIDSFPDSVVDQVTAVLDTFDRQGARVWVIDLRNNGGGTLQAESSLLSKLIPDGLLFYVWDREGKRTDFRADGSYRGHVAPMVVLVNEGTGSGGEMFAAAIQDYKLGRVVGARTAGCVGTGRLFQLPDGSGLQVTVGNVLTGVSNRILNRIGVTPDVEVGMSLQDLIEGRDPQLDAALRLAAAS